MRRPGNLLMGPRLKFLLFTLIVLGLPALLMGASEPRFDDLGKLALILSPGLAGLALNRGLGHRDEPLRWRGLGTAFAVSLAITCAALAVSLAARAAHLGGSPLPAPAAALGGTLLTSVLEELGWAGGGLALALKAFGRRAGVLVLGLVWATWHLGPAFLKVGLFPDLETAPPAMLGAFVLGCLAYRELLTRLVEGSRSWIAAAIAHSAANVALTVFVWLGGVVQGEPGQWPLFPAPGGLVFIGLVGFAIGALARRRRAAATPLPDAGPA